MTEDEMLKKITKMINKAVFFGRPIGHPAFYEYIKVSGLWTEIFIIDGFPVIGNAVKSPPQGAVDQDNNLIEEES